MTTHHGFLVHSNEKLAMTSSGQCLSKEDIESQRLASKELCPTRRREFAMRYVTQPVVALSQYGLQSLVDICKHPIFGP